MNSCQKCPVEKIIDIWYASLSRPGGRVSLAEGVKEIYGVWKL